MGGLAGLAVVGAVYDVWAIATHRETISAAVRRLRRTPAGRMIVGAAATALLVHFAEGDL